MYGSLTEPYYSPSDLKGQLALYTIWGVVLFLLIGTPHPRPMNFKFWSLLFAGGCFSVSYVLLCVRYGYMIHPKSADITYRYASSGVISVQRIGMVFVFIAIYPMATKRLWNIVFFGGLGVYAILNAAYIIYDWIISSQAIEAFKENYEIVPQWWLSDRDFALTFTSDQINRLLINGTTELPLTYVQSRMYNLTAEDFHRDRGIQISIGAAADFFALAIAFAIMVVAMIKLMENKAPSKMENKWFAAAAGGLIVTTFFRSVVTGRYVMWNWDVLGQPKQWGEWFDTYNSSGSAVTSTVSEREFLSGYRATESSFPVLQALFEPIGVVVALWSMVISRLGLPLRV